MPCKQVQGRETHLHLSLGFPRTLAGDYKEGEKGIV